jgi:peptidyl-prolyl cis-trans isomerase-like 3
VISGWDTLDALEQVEVNNKHRPLKEVRLKSVTIHANPLAEENVTIAD